MVSPIDDGSYARILSKPVFAGPLDFLSGSASSVASDDLASYVIANLSPISHRDDGDVRASHIKPKSNGMERREI